MHKAIVSDLRALSFPSAHFAKAQEEDLDHENKYRWCQSFGEAASAIFISGSTAQFFLGFFKGFPDAILSWFPYLEINEFEFPTSFRFDTSCSNDYSTTIFQCIVKPEWHPMEFRHGQEKPPPSYEFYNPSVVACQLGFGQLPLGLFFVSKIWPGEALT